jgi:hypothetical protein
MGSARTSPRLCPKIAAEVVATLRISCIVRSVLFLDISKNVQCRDERLLHWLKARRLRDVWAPNAKDFAGSQRARRKRPSNAAREGRNQLASLHSIASFEPAVASKISALDDTRMQRSGQFCPARGAENCSAASRMAPILAVSFAVEMSEDRGSLTSCRLLGMITNLAQCLWQNHCPTEIPSLSNRRIRPVRFRCRFVVDANGF